jgi:hypothetical protein
VFRTFLLLVRVGSNLKGQDLLTDMPDRAAALEGGSLTVLLAGSRVIQIITITPTDTSDKAGFAAKVPPFPGASGVLHGWTLGADVDCHPGAAARPPRYIVCVGFSDLEDYVKSESATSSVLAALGPTESVSLCPTPPVSGAAKKGRVGES